MDVFVVENRNVNLILISIQQHLESMTTWSFKLVFVFFYILNSYLVYISSANFDIIWIALLKQIVIVVLNREISKNQK